MRRKSLAVSEQERQISTHTPHARCDGIGIFIYNFYVISTHTPHARCDMWIRRQLCILLDFYSHTSCEVRPSTRAKNKYNRNFYSHTSCEVRRIAPTSPTPRTSISTHTPHARCDKWRCSVWIHRKDFYSHTSCEVRLKNNDRRWHYWRFLLTHLMRGATEKSVYLINPQQVFLLTHLMRGATIELKNIMMFSWFLLTHLMRGATSGAPKADTQA